jgi:hypothetical protein
MFHGKYEVFLEAGNSVGVGARNQSFMSALDAGFLERLIR